MKISIRRSWNSISPNYQKNTIISLNDVHYGPLMAGEKKLNLLGNVKKKKVLEMGCGGGQNSTVLAKWGANVTGIDISENQIAYAKDLARREKVNVKFIVSNMEKLTSIPSKSIDIVISSFAIHYADNIEKTFREVGRVLKLNGVFVLCDGHPVNYFNWIRHKGKDAIVIGNYFKRRKVYWVWRSVGKVKLYDYYRNFQDYIEPLIKNGFVIERFLEPEILDMRDIKRGRSPYVNDYYKKWYKRWKRNPLTFIIKARKVTE